MAKARECLREAIHSLTRAGCDTPRLDAELLLAKALGRKREWLLAHLDAEVSEAQAARFRALTARRAGREPLPYILGQVEFYGLAFKVDKRVLIPRPETELLVEKALDWAQREARQGHKLTIADVGTGSGAIAVTLAVHIGERATIYALDSSPQALEVARENARNHGVEARIVFLRSDLLSALPEPVDLIVANLPYVASGELATLAPELAHEPRQALDGGADGLSHIRRLLAQARRHMRPQGALILEVSPAQARTVMALAQKHCPSAITEIHRDYAGLNRVVMVQWRVDGARPS